MHIKKLYLHPPLPEHIQLHQPLQPHFPPRVGSPIAVSPPVKTIPSTTTPRTSPTPPPSPNTLPTESRFSDSSRSHLSAAVCSIIQSVVCSRQQQRTTNNRFIIHRNNRWKIFERAPPCPRTTKRHPNQLQHSQQLQITYIIRSMTILRHHPTPPSVRSPALLPNSNQELTPVQI